MHLHCANESQTPTVNYRRQTVHSSLFYTEQTDEEGLGRKLLLTPSGDPRGAPEKQTVGTVTASQKMLTLQALSSSLNAGAAKEGCLDREEAFECPSGSLSPRTAAPIYTL